MQNAKLGFSQGFSEDVSPVVFGSNFLHLEPALFDLVSKMVPFD
jgi:hypothetical protein